MLSHDNMIFTQTSVSEDIFESQPEDWNFQPEDMRVVSYLPLSHVAASQMDLIYPVLYGNQLFYARPDALQGTIVETLKWAKPTVFFAVPRIWEKFEDRLKEAGAASPAIMQSISGWAKGHGT